MRTIRFDDPRLPRLMQSGAILSGYGVGFGEPDGYLLMDDEDEPVAVQPQEEEPEPAAWTNARAAEEIEAQDRRREMM